LSSDAEQAPPPSGRRAVMRTAAAIAVSAAALTLSTAQIAKIKG
jgi:hypothetical protein